MARGQRTAGLSGVALFLGAGGLYLAYAGVRDVPLVDGLRDLLRGEPPVGKAAGVYTPVALTDTGKAAGTVTGSGNLGLVGYAALAYPVIHAAFPRLVIGGYRATGSVPGSDHPRGLAMDVMTTDPDEHRRIIAVARLTPGLSYWISKGKIASESHGWQVRTYTGPNPHDDHVHLSYKAA